MKARGTPSGREQRQKHVESKIWTDSDAGKRNQEIENSEVERGSSHAYTDLSVIKNIYQHQNLYISHVSTSMQLYCKINRDLEVYL